jgi:hypothetical protein
MPGLGMERGAPVNGIGSELDDWRGVRDRVIAAERARGRMPPIFHPVLASNQIGEVEVQIGVELPEAYAAFLAEVGSGGPGPECALTTLCKVDGRWAWVWEDDTILATDARGPFLENEEWIGHQIVTLRAAGHEPTVRDEDEDYCADYLRAFGDDEGFRLFHEQRLCGSIHISDNGCGMTSWLVMTGPHRGEIWFRDAAPNAPFEPLLDAGGRPHNFYTWYLDWLERKEASVGLRPAGADRRPAEP